MIKKILGSLFGGSVKDVAAGAGTLLEKIDNLSMGDGEKSELRAKVVDKLIDAQLGALENVRGEIASKHWLAANWRPVLAVQWGLIVTYTYFVGPMFELPVVQLPDKIYELLVVCITGYGGLRSVEKVAGSIVPAFTARQLRKLKKAGIETEE